MKLILIGLLTFFSFTCLAQENVSIKCSIDKTPDLSILVESEPLEVNLVYKGSGTTFDLTEMYEVKVDKDILTVSLKNNSEKDLLVVNMNTRTGVAYSKIGSSSVACFLLD